jgi:hypothetical protein
MLLLLKKNYTFDSNGKIKNYYCCCCFFVVVIVIIIIIFIIVNIIYIIIDKFEKNIIIIKK